MLAWMAMTKTDLRESVRTTAAWADVHCGNGRDGATAIEACVELFSIWLQGQFHPFAAGRGDENGGESGACCSLLSFLQVFCRYGLQ